VAAGTRLHAGRIRSGLGLGDRERADSRAVKGGGEITAPEGRVSRERDGKCAEPVNREYRIGKSRRAGNGVACQAQRTQVRRSSVSRSASHEQRENPVGRGVANEGTAG